MTQLVATDNFTRWLVSGRLSGALLPFNGYRNRDDNGSGGGGSGYVPK